MQYRISPSSNVSARSFGDEVIAANFVRGVYYSLLGPAAQIWEGLLAGVPLDRVVAEVSALSNAEPAAFAAASNSLVEALLAEVVGCEIHDCGTAEGSEKLPREMFLATERLRTAKAISY